MIQCIYFIKRYYYTLKELKVRQLAFQFYYRFRLLIASLNKGRQISIANRAGYSLDLSTFLKKPISFDNGVFTFLNLAKPFGADLKAIDWEFNGYGKLWAYSLNYFDFLFQPGMDRETGISLIEGFIVGTRSDSTGFEPYPISLRGINWIKFLSIYRIERADINGSLHAQYLILLNRLEYHLLGNHLLENAYSLLFGAFYFRERVWYNKACRLLCDELEEQVLGDGAHFELSPMYHQILLNRLLDSVNLVQHNLVFEGQKALLDFLKEKVYSMSGWLQAISFSDGSIPNVNDSTGGVAPSSSELFAYSERLGFGETRGVNLFDSGYRKFKGSGYECLVDVGCIGPAYIPGHAHADTFNFVLYVQERPFLVDTGTSTYEKGALRDEERGTAAHNTVVVNGENSSDVWGGFRVGRAAHVTVLDESKNTIMAEHDGYSQFGVLHRRFWGFEERRIIVRDELFGRVDVAEARFHFDHALNVVLDEGIVSCQGVQLCFKGAYSVHCEQYRQALGFNHTDEACCIVVEFSNTLETEIQFT